MGTHPRNTMFSYNYHNVRHIISFLERWCQEAGSSRLSILDVGGGSSPYLELLGKVASLYVAVDVDATASQQGIARVCGVAEKLPFADGFFDIVLSNQVLEHVEDERCAAAEAFRVLKPGGLFLGSVPHISPIHLEPHDYRRFTSLGLERLLTCAGFQNILIEGNGGVYRAMALSLLMDQYLSVYEKGRSQRFRHVKHFALFPVNGVVNLLAAVLDGLKGDSNRSPSNYCWRSQKPGISEHF